MTTALDRAGYVYSTRQDGRGQIHSRFIPPAYDSDPGSPQARWVCLVCEAAGAWRDTRFNNSIAEREGELEAHLAAHHEFVNDCDEARDHYGIDVACDDIDHVPGGDWMHELPCRMATCTKVFLLCSTVYEAVEFWLDGEAAGA